jgi:hypothetical protein
MSRKVVEVAGYVDHMSAYSADIDTRSISCIVVAIYYLDVVLPK